MSTFARMLFASLCLSVLFACNGSDHAGPHTVASPDAIMLKDPIRQRSLYTRYWYPADVASLQSLPLLIVAHGLGGLPEEFEWLAEHMASHGYVVLAPRFPHTNRHNRDAVKRDDVLNQPGDISLLINRAINNAIAPELKDKIDAERIAIAGHSFGGLTSFLTAYDKDFGDERVKAAIMMGSAGGDFLGPTYYSNQTPMLLLHGNKDLLINIEQSSRLAFERSSGPSTLVNFIGGNHFGFTNMPSFGFNFDSLACWMISDLLEDPMDVTFFDSLKNRANSGIVPFTAELPCSFDASDSAYMSHARQRLLSKQLVHAYLDTQLQRDPEAFSKLQANLQRSAPDLNIQRRL